jgi:hypothetical protein
MISWNGRFTTPRLNPVDTDRFRLLPYYGLAINPIWVEIQDNDCGAWGFIRPDYLSLIVL